jgi:leucyl-tRNA synthetase
MSTRPIHELEAKWQARWEAEGTYRAQAPEEAPKAEKFYGLVEFPYPSGEGLHVGHPRSYTAIDLVTRKRRMEGKNVLYPIGWDAFGLPTENFAIKHKIPPAEATRKNVANFTRQIKSIGFGFDWDHEVNTTDPAYYKWTQWQFLQFVKAGLAYKAASTINWCPKCKIGLPMPMQQPMNQMPYNANPMSNMGMGGIFNQLGQMGMGGQSGFSPMMNPYGNMGGFRMW